MTDEEIRQLIKESEARVLEKAMLTFPEIVGNLITQTVANHKITSKFYADHPEFAKHKDLVAATIEKIDGANPLKSYEEKLKDAIPSIRESIKTKSHLNLDSVSLNPNRDFNGAI